MSLTKFTDNLNIISSLPDKPALESSELKAKFDEAANKIKGYVNETLTEEVEKIITDNVKNLKTLIEEKMSKAKKDALQIAFPVGSTYITQTNINPYTILEFGTWERLKGKICLGLDEKDKDFNTIGKTGGEKTHTLTIDEMPSHNHTWAGGLKEGALVSDYPRRAGNSEYKSFQNGINYTGGNKAHNNMQPYEITGYMWIRRS